MAGWMHGCALVTDCSDDIWRQWVIYCRRQTNDDVLYWWSCGEARRPASESDAHSQQASDILYRGHLTVRGGGAEANFLPIFILFATYLAASGEKIKRLGWKWKVQVCIDCLVFWRFSYKAGHFHFLNSTGGLWTRFPCSELSQNSRTLPIRYLFPRIAWRWRLTTVHICWAVVDSWLVGSCDSDSCRYDCRLMHDSGPGRPAPVGSANRRRRLRQVAVVDRLWWTGLVSDWSLSQWSRFYCPSSVAR